MKLWTFAGFAMRIRHGEVFAHYFVGFVPGGDETKSRESAMDLVFEWYPVAQGYINHGISFSEIPRETLDFVCQHDDSEDIPSMPRSFLDDQ